jgi:ribosomal protein L34
MAIVCVDGLDAVGEGYQNQAKGRNPESGNEEKFRTTEGRKVLKFLRSEREERYEALLERAKVSALP